MPLSLMPCIHHTPTPTQAAAVFCEKHADLFQALALEHSPDASAKAMLGPRPSLHNLADGLREWGFKFRVLLERNLKIYMRNPGNALARFLVYTSVGIAAGVLCFDIGKKTGPQAAADFIGKSVVEFCCLLQF